MVNENKGLAIFLSIIEKSLSLSLSSTLFTYWIYCTKMVYSLKMDYRKNFDKHWEPVKHLHIIYPHTIPFHCSYISAKKQQESVNSILFNSMVKMLPTNKMREHAHITFIRKWPKYTASLSKAKCWTIIKIDNVIRHFGICIDT